MPSPPSPRSFPASPVCTASPSGPSTSTADRASPPLVPRPRTFRCSSSMPPTRPTSSPPSSGSVPSSKPSAASDRPTTSPSLPVPLATSTAPTRRPRPRSPSVSCTSVATSSRSRRSMPTSALPPRPSTSSFPRSPSVPSSVASTSPTPAPILSPCPLSMVLPKWSPSAASWIGASRRCPVPSRVGSVFTMPPTILPCLFTACPPSPPMRPR